MIGFMKSWYIREGKMLMKACTILVWKNDGLFVGCSNVGMDKQNGE